MKALLIHIALMCLVINCQCSDGKDIRSDPYWDIQNQRIPKTVNADENMEKKLHLINATALAPGYVPCPTYIGANGIYTIKVPGLAPFSAYCDANIAGPGWIVIARRTNDKLNFFLNWQQYKQGFGNLTEDFFIGLDKLHAITKAQNHELYVHLEDFEGETRYAKYDEFLIASEHEMFAIQKLGVYTGDASDSLRYQEGMKFTTYDRDNDNSKDTNCAITFIGPWWHNQCRDSHLFGLYLRGEYSKEFDAKGMLWKYWRGMHYSYKTMQMMVRPK